MDVLHNLTQGDTQGCDGSFSNGTKFLKWELFGNKIPLWKELSSQKVKLVHNLGDTTPGRGAGGNSFALKFRADLWTDFLTIIGISIIPGFAAPLH